MQLQHMRQDLLVNLEALGAFPLRDDMHDRIGKLRLQNISPLLGNPVIADQKDTVSSDVFSCLR